MPGRGRVTLTLALVAGLVIAGAAGWVMLKAGAVSGPHHR